MAKSNTDNNAIPIVIAMMVAFVAFALLAPPLLIVVGAIFSLWTALGWKSLLVRILGIAASVAVGVIYASQIYWLSQFVWTYRSVTSLEALSIPWAIVNGAGLLGTWGAYFVSGGSLGQVARAATWFRPKPAPKKDLLDGMILEDRTGRRPDKTFARPGKAPRPVCLGLVPYPSDKSETLHTVIEGATGSGKTQAIKTLVAAALERGDCVIAIDGGGDLFSAFEHQADDVIRFDLMGGHNQGWSPANEIERRADWAQLAQGLFGDGKGDSVEWISMAKTLFAGVMAGYAQACREEDRPFSNAEALALLTTAPAQALEPFVQGSAAAAIVANDKGLNAIRMSLLRTMDFYQYLPRKTSDFSIRRHVQRTMQDPGQTALFVTYNERDLATVKTLLSAVVEMVINTAIDVRHSDKRIWLIVDELAGLGEIPALLNGAAKLRKTGVRLLVGMQDYDQIEDLYGRARAASITNNLSNKLVLRSTSPQTAERLAKTLGDQRVAMFTQNAGRSGKAFEAASRNISSNMSEKIENTVMPATIQSLPDLTGFVKMAGDNKIIKTKIPVYGGTPDDLSHDAKHMIKNGEPVFVARG